MYLLCNHINKILNWFDFYRFLQKEEARTNASSKEITRLISVLLFLTDLSILEGNGRVLLESI